MQTALWLQVGNRLLVRQERKRAEMTVAWIGSSKHGRREADTTGLGFVEFDSLIISILLSNVA